MLAKTQQEANYWLGVAELGAKNFTANDRGQAKLGNAAMLAVSLVVGLVVAAIVAAFILPIGIEEIVAQDTSNWSSGAQSLWDTLDIWIVLAVFLFFIALALSAARNV